MGPGIGDLPAEYAPATGGVDAPITRYQETSADGKKSYLIQKGDTTGQADNTGVYVIPAHCYFMMGDNRDNSDDSRFDPEMPSNLTGTQTCGWDESVDKYLPPGEGVGFVPEEDLVGKAQIILLSWKPGSSLFNPTTWLNLRWDRWFHGLK
jgi:signal peptidase I